MPTRPVVEGVLVSSEGETPGVAGAGQRAVYRIQGETGALTPLATYAMGQRPMAVLVTQVGG